MTMRRFDGGYYSLEDDFGQQCLAGKSYIFDTDADDKYDNIC